MVKHPSIGIGILAVLAVATIGGALGFETGQRSSAPAAPAADHGPAPTHDVRINRPDAPPGVLTGRLDAQGQPVLANCTTCHATRPPNTQTHDGEQLVDFHTGLITNHGGLACLACHNGDDYSTLHLADGAAVPFIDLMRLCAQCHGPQYRDYRSGSHGGMNGHWDLTRGGRTRNNCIDCHDAHAPQYPTMSPVFRPRDRFLTQGADHDG